MSIQQAAESPGSRDGAGGGDHDETYRFGWRPRAIAPFPFSTHQYVRLLLLRSCIQDGLTGRDDLAPDLSVDSPRSSAPTAPPYGSTR